jgi:hypothetical protein
LSFARQERKLRGEVKRRRSVEVSALQTKADSAWLNERASGTARPIIIDTLIAIFGTLIAIVGTLIAIISTLIAIIGTLIAIIGTLIAIIGTLSTRTTSARRPAPSRMPLARCCCALARCLHAQRRYPAWRGIRAYPARRGIRAYPARRGPPQSVRHCELPPGRTRRAPQSPKVAKKAGARVSEIAYSPPAEPS